MSNRKLQIFLIHPPFAQALGHTGSRICPFARPLSTASCQRRSIPPLPKTGAKHKKYHYVYSPVDMGSAAPSETISTRWRRPASGTALRPTERLQRSSANYFSPLSLDPHKRNLGTFGLCVPRLTRHAGKEKWRWCSKRAVIVRGTVMQCRLDCYWPASERLEPFRFYLCFGSTNGYQALDMMEVRDGEPDISRQTWSIHQLMRNKQLRPFLQMAEDEGLLGPPGTRLNTLNYKDVINKCATFHPFTIHYFTTHGKKRAFLRLRPNTFDPYLQSNSTSDIILWDPTIAGISFFQHGDVEEADVPGRVVWLAPAVIRRSSSTSHDPKREFRVCLLEKKTLEPVHVRDTAGRPALWSMRYDQLRELVQLAGQGDTVNVPRASLLARVFLHSSLWHEAILAWDTEAQEQFDKSMVSERNSRGSPRCRTCGEYGHSTRICPSKHPKAINNIAENDIESHTASVAPGSFAGGASVEMQPRIGSGERRHLTLNPILRTIST